MNPRSRRGARPHTGSARLPLRIRAQPDDSTCGPTCLHAVYRYYGDRIHLQDVIAETRTLPEGGTLGVYLGLHALQRGYRVTIYTYNLQVFDPTWFAPGGPDIRERLAAQQARRRSPKLRSASAAYGEFLGRGGTIRLSDLTPALVRRLLRRRTPVLAGLNATFLYRCARERVDAHGTVDDDVGGDPMGHFVVLHGYDERERAVHVADPLSDNPVAQRRRYTVPIARVLNAVLLGIVTYDANLVVIDSKR